MASPRALKPDFAGHAGPSDRVLQQTADAAAVEAEATQPEGMPPASIPRHTYETTSISDRRKAADERIKAGEEQRFQLEMEWEATIAQLEVVENFPGHEEEQVVTARKAERNVRMRLATQDRILEKLATFRQKKIR